LNKLPELHHVLYSDSSIDCVCVTESWLQDGITDSLLDPKQAYSVLRYDRAGHRGGGVCVFVKGCYNVIRKKVQHVPDNVELVCFDLLDSDVVYRMFVVYRPPSVSSSASYDFKVDVMQQLVSCLETGLNKHGPTVIIGDFNCPDIDWLNPSHSMDICQKLFYDFTVNNGFSQCVSSPTRLCNILDLVLVNDPFIISRIDVSPPFSTSDHNVVNVDIIYCKQQHTVSRSQRKKFLWKSGDYDGMRNYLLHYNWDNLFTYNLTHDSLWRAFCKVLDDAIEQFVPYKFVCCGQQNLPKKKYPRQVQKLISRKRCLWRHYKRHSADEDCAISYKKAATECRTAIKNFEIQQEKEIIDAGNTGRFYKYINQKLGRSHKIGILKGAAGSNITDDAEKANLLNSYFNSVNTVDDKHTPEFQPRNANNATIDSVNFTPGLLHKICKMIKPKMSCGPDGYPPFLLKSIVSAVSSPLCLLYQSFMSVGKVPTDWKIAHVTPIFKKGNSSDPSNYRPISLTSIFSKLMERMVVSQILEHLRTHGMISKQQHGFLSKRSTATNMLESLNDWTICFENGYHETVAYVDFAKAFDSVCHRKLIVKLQQYGVTGVLLEWVKDFLTGRSQRTIVGQCLSDVGYISSGVVQGSCLGPLLFLIYINDLADLFSDEAVIKLYADDVKLYSNVATDALNVTFDLQDKLNKLAEWATMWQLPISYSKCCTLTITSGRVDRSLPQQVYVVDAHSIQSVPRVVDLGVTVDNTLKFSSHINKIRSKASKRANLLLRCFESRNLKSLISAFKIYVRPILEYCSVVWNPCTVKDIITLESVQRQFTKRLPGMNAATYPQRLAKLELESLELRRIRADLLFTYKLVFGIIDLKLSDFFISNFHRLSRRHQYQLYLPPCKKGIRFNSYPYRVLHVWNNLPSNEIDFSTFNKFRSTVKSKHLLQYCKVCFE